MAVEVAASLVLILTVALVALGFETWPRLRPRKSTTEESTR